ncbi:MAG: RagB/SusD family nutrient uptake outer membrane protein [Flavobacteriaceae bacterium]|nr:RagB/SusD family nutrient uptake outer membrane protein [Flavobacteriaceae bacterium]
MKNKFILILASAFITLTFQSCEDQLDIDPNSSLIAGTAFKNVDDLQNALNSSYARLNTRAITFNSIFTDNTKLGKDNGGQETQLHSLILDESNGTSAVLWNSRYAIINKTARIIEASKIIDITGSESRVNHILGQSYALRAFAHFELFQYFTPDYLNKEGLAVPAVNTIITIENLPRNTVAEVIALIETDLAKAISLLDTSETNNKYITLDFITALKARLYITTGDYGIALSNANSLIAKYPLANRTQYENMYLDSDNTEVIFKVARVTGDNRIGNTWHFSGGGPFIEMSNSLYNTLEVDDIRRNVLFNEADSNPDENLHKINKYPGTAEEFLSDYKVFRVSEMYLIKAEVEIRNKDYAASKITLKSLKDARFPTPTATGTYSAVADGLTYVLAERRIELAYEGHRYLDLKRFGKGLVRDDKDCSGLNDACSISSDDRRFTLPIPLSEMNANTLMTQNPGY